MRRLGAYDLIAARDLAGPADPGRASSTCSPRATGGVEGAGERPYLPRAFSFARVRPGAGGGADLQFLLEDVGPGTRRLGGARARGGADAARPARAAVRAPPSAAGRPVLVGGGIGTAPILALHDERPAAPGRARLPLGRPRRGGGPVRRRGRAGHRRRLGRAPRPGHRAAARAARRRPATRRSTPAARPPMLEAVRALCDERGTPAQLALEAGMACGYGACFGCVVANRRGLQARLRRRARLRGGRRSSPRP